MKADQQILPPIIPAILCVMSYFIYTCITMTLFDKKHNYCAKKFWLNNCIYVVAMWPFYTGCLPTLESKYLMTDLSGYHGCIHHPQNGLIATVYMQLLVEKF